MANYNADIKIGVTGKAQLNQLESQLKRVNTQITKLNKALTLKTRAQTVKLNTKGANTAIKQLEDRINKLGRTITVNLRTRESKGGGAGSSTTVIAPQQASQLATSLGLAAAATKQTVEQTTELGEQIKKVNTLESDVLDKNKELTEVYRRQDQVRKGFAEKGKSLKQSERDLTNSAKLREAAQARRTAKLEEELRILNQQDAAQRKLLNLEKQRTGGKSFDQRLAAVRAKNSAASKIGKGFRTGAGIAGASAAGNIPVLGEAVTGGLVAGLSGGSVAAGALGGALVGIAAGAVAATKEVTTFNNELQLMQQSLAFTVSNSDELDTALGAIESASQDFIVPIGEATKQFTKLNAAARSSGFSVEEVEKVYRGLAAANLALGGNTERLNGILLATQQVFSKGKVQAEELRGQISERLSGAFAEFAKATGRTTKELDKALNDGEVSLKDFVTFAEKMLEKYEEKAKVIGDAPQNAGRRLQLAMDDLKKAMGPILQSIGNAFTKMATKAVEALTYLANKINAFRLQAAEGRAAMARDNLQAAQTRLRLAQDAAKTQGGSRAQPFGGVRAGTNDVAGFKRDVDAAQTALNELKATMINMDLVPGGDPLTPQVGDFVGGDSGGGGSKGGGGGRTKVDNLAERIRLAEQALAISKLELAYAKEIDPLEQLRLERDRDILQIRQNMTNDLINEKDVTVQRLIKEKAVTDELTRQQELLRDIGTDAGFSMGTTIADAMNDTNKELTETDKLLRSAYDIMAGGMQDAINGLIRGTKDLNDVLSDMLGQLGNLFIQFAFNSLKTSIFPGMATGGYPTPGKPVLVGENGPELIVPTAPTRVYNNHDTNAMLGKYSPGSGGGTITFESRIINNVEYVTAEQAIAMSEDAAKRGAEGGYTKTMGSLRNSRSTRQRVGI